MKAFKIENNVVANIIEVDDINFCEGLIEATDDDFYVSVGDQYENGVFISNQPTPSQEEIENNLRNYRNFLLLNCDWTMLPDAKLSDESKSAWETYRQSLRDLPATAGWPENIIWPVSP
jgi:hypothetical protein